MADNVFSRLINEVVDRFNQRSVQRLTDGGVSNNGGLFQYMPSISTLGLTQEPVKGAGFRKAENAYIERADRTAVGLSTYVGSDRPSIIADQYEREIAEPEARKRLVKQYKEQLTDDPYLYTGLRILTHGAVGDGFSLNFTNFDSKSETLEQMKARQKMATAYKIMYPKLSIWCENFAGLGDQYTQLVADQEDRLLNFKSMPIETMERRSDYTDEFADPYNAFKQRDALSRQEYGMMSAFQVVHGRFNKPDGDRYGRGLLLACRQSVADSMRMYANLIKRQLRDMPIATYRVEDADGNALFGRALKRFKEGSDGEPSSALPEIRAQRGEVEAVEGLYPYRIVNGKGDFKLETPALQLGETRQITALVDRYLSVLSVPLAILNGTVVNYATLQALLSQLYAMQRIIAKAFELEVIRPLFDRVLLLANIDPDTIEYELDWGQKVTQQELKDMCLQANEAYKIGGLSTYSYVSIQFQLYGKKDVEAEVDRIKQDRQDGLLPLVRGVAQELAAELQMYGKNANIAGSIEKPDTDIVPADPNVPIDIETEQFNEMAKAFNMGHLVDSAFKNGNGKLPKNT